MLEILTAMLWRSLKYLAPYVIAITILVGAAAVVCWPRYYLEFEFSGSGAGSFQVYYATPEHGFSDDHVLATPIHSGQVHRFPLPISTLTAARIDLGTGYVSGHVAAPVISDGSGRRIAVLNIDAAQQNELAALTVTSDGFEFSTAIKAADPWVRLAFAPIDLLQDGRRMAAGLLVRLLGLSIVVLAFANRHRSFIPRLAALSKGNAWAAAWASAASVTYFRLAERSWSLGWNAYEFLIGANLLEYGRYAVSPFYPLAIWRPILGTSVATVASALVADPFLSFSIITALSIGIFVASMFFAGRLIARPWGGHLSAALALICPGIVLLLLHVHGLSHIVLLGVLGPAVVATVYILKGPPLAKVALAAGVLWGASVMARPDAVFLALLSIGLIAIAAVRQRRIRAAAAAIVSFVTIVGAVQTWTTLQADREDLLVGRGIYQFYNSQAWSDPNPQSPGIDIEAEGYTFATELYGTPAENDESIVKAISKNPDAFLSRVGKNVAAVTRLILAGTLISPFVVFAGFLGGLSVLAGLLASGRMRLTDLWLVASIPTAGYILVLHVDPRYLTIYLPMCMLLAVRMWAGLDSLLRPHPLPRAIALSSLAVSLTVSSGTAFAEMAEGLRSSPRDRAPIKELAAQFTTLVGPVEPYTVVLGIIAADAHGLAGDGFAFDYLTKSTPRFIAGPTIYPKAAYFSWKHCPATHLLVPTTMPKPWHGTALGVIRADGIGPFAVVRTAAQLRSPDEDCTPPR